MGQHSALETQGLKKPALAWQQPFRAPVLLVKTVKHDSTNQTARNGAAKRAFAALREEVEPAPKPWPLRRDNEQERRGKGWGQKRALSEKGRMENTSVSGNCP